MKAYKLFRKTPKGELKPLFINAKQVLPIGEWLRAENHPTKGFAQRQGWHCCLTPHAPHLVMKPKGGMQRVWVEIEVAYTEKYKRPESQGGTWVLAQRMRIVKELSCKQVEKVLS